ncbi:uncharacterized protein [Aquarana catesbeiana]|uniref:uncharacterized protein n=1 Tax=Aquarana catesbeiana TaxID=8400 RepID=UPI003CC98681
MSNCTEVCGQGKSARSCSKICLVTVYPTGKRERAVKMYAVLDEQSNRSIAKSDFFDIFNLKASAVPYTLRTCAGTIETTGRRASDFTIESFNKKVQFPLPTLIECGMIPDDKTEIPSPEVAHHNPHLRSITHLIPAVEPDVSILLLLGRDILQVHKVRQQINGPYNAPYAQRLDLGWVIVGEVCLGTVHQPDNITTLKTSVLTNGRTSLLSPCHNSFIVKESFGRSTQHCDSSTLYGKEEVNSNIETDNLGITVFQKTKDDDKQALSIEDQTFLQIMDREAYQDDNHSWMAPHPFRTPRCVLSSNREQAMKRLHSLSKTLQRKSKISPKPAHTIPRLELCAAVLAVEMSELITDELDIDFDAVKFFTDSKTVLGYICSTTRRFHLYVSNRVNRIRLSSHPDQWFYVSTEQNPADYATRPTQAACLQNSIWFSGPSFLYQPHCEQTDTANVYPLIEPEADPEIRPEITSFSTKASEATLHSHCFDRFSCWRILVKTLARLIHVAKTFRRETNSDQVRRWESFHEQVNLVELAQAKSVIISSVQNKHFQKEIDCIKKQKTFPKQSRLRRLSPFLDKNGLLRVGGRLSLAELSEEEKQPVIIPYDHHVATLLVRYYHKQVVHQGRHVTEGAIRSAVLWILGGKCLVSAVIHKCVICRKLREKLQSQKMAELPEDRVIAQPPFTNVGLDVFGPWSVLTRRTRGGSADSKRWAVLFTCLSTRAVHIELLEVMSTSSFINALRRFFSIRGPEKLLRSDRGTNFVGACKELNICDSESQLQDFLQDRGCTWVFNPPHSSHMGGVWERLIGIARRILDAMWLQTKPAHLTHETLSTFMAIMNARPIIPVSSDPDTPMVLTPAMLLTQKMNSLSAPSGTISTTQVHAKQWKQVQCLADTFWKRWKREYLSNLQRRRKWTEDRPNIKVGDVVLLKDSQEGRNKWPVGLIVNVLPSRDGKVRKVEVKSVKNETARIYLRPIAEIIVLISD